MNKIISYVIEMCQNDYKFLREIIRQLESIADEWEEEKNDVSELEKCIDYNILKLQIPREILGKINKIIKHYNDYLKKYDNGIDDVIGDYERAYGNDYVIEWYEGILGTQEFIEEIKYGYLGEI